MIFENVQQIWQNIAAAAKKVGRSPNEVALMAVTKTRSVNEIKAVIQAGIHHIGENRVQEFQQKYTALTDITANYHLIGHLQTNKVKAALECFDWIDAVDSLRLAEAIQKQAEKLNRNIDILVEVNTSGEESKFGVLPAQTAALVEQLSVLPNLRVRGLMTIGAFVEDMEIVRQNFRQLRQLRDHIANQNWPNVDMKHLSMGMTHDYEVAIEEGATIVRVGTAIFGPRLQK